MKKTVKRQTLQKKHKNRKQNTKKKHYLRKNIGGKLLGKGATGDVYDLCSREDSEVYCKKFEKDKDNIKEILLYYNTKYGVQINIEIFEQFLNKIFENEIK